MLNALCKQGGTKILAMYIWFQIAARSLCIVVFEKQMFG